MALKIQLTISCLQHFSFICGPTLIARFPHLSCEWTS